jgi:hypothetical protein
MSGELFIPERSSEPSSFTPPLPDRLSRRPEELPSTIHFPPSVSEAIGKSLLSAATLGMRSTEKITEEGSRRPLMTYVTNPRSDEFRPTSYDIARFSRRKNEGMIFMIVTVWGASALVRTERSRNSYSLIDAIIDSNSIFLYQHIALHANLLAQRNSVPGYTHAMAARDSGLGYYETTPGYLNPGSVMLNGLTFNRQEP